MLNKHKHVIFSSLFIINKLQYAITSAGRIIIGLYGQVVPKTVGMSLFFCFGYAYSNVRPYFRRKNKQSQPLIRKSVFDRGRESRSSKTVGISLLED